MNTTYEYKYTHAVMVMYALVRIRTFLEIKARNRKSARTLKGPASSQFRQCIHVNIILNRIIFQSRGHCWIAEWFYYKLHNDFCHMRPFQTAKGCFYPGLYKVVIRLTTFQYRDARYHVHSCQRGYQTKLLFFPCMYVSVINKPI